MQKNPAIAAAAQKIRLDDNGDLMIFDHLASMRRTQTSFHKLVRVAFACGNDGTGRGRAIVFAGHQARRASVLT
jgi:hypothetical protein